MAAIKLHNIRCLEAALLLADGALECSGSWQPFAFLHCPSLERCASLPANPAHSLYRAAMPARGFISP
jgi:hypothetical protein